MRGNEVGLPVPSLPIHVLRRRQCVNRLTFEWDFKCSESTSLLLEGSNPFIPGHMSMWSSMSAMLLIPKLLWLWKMSPTKTRIETTLSVSAPILPRDITWCCIDAWSREDWLIRIRHAALRNFQQHRGSWQTWPRERRARVRGLRTWDCLSEMSQLCSYQMC